MKEKNYWPTAIICVLLFGVFMVSVSITIAMKNPIQDENTYFAKKRVVDENINTIIKEQNLFNAIYEHTIWIESNAETYIRDTFVFPYNAPAHRPDIKTSLDNTIPPNDVKLYIELKQKMPLYEIDSIHLYLDSMRQANQVLDLGEILILSESLPENLNTTKWSSKTLQLPVGRWKFIIEITYKTTADKAQSTQKAYFESEVFIKDIKD